MSLEYTVEARRIDAAGSTAQCKQASLRIDSSLAGSLDAFNPAELFLAALAGCIIKGIERVTPMLHFELRGVDVRLRAVRQDSPPRIASVQYEITVDTDESEQRLELLHTNVRKYGTIYNTVSDAVALSGTLARKP